MPSNTLTLALEGDVSLHLFAESMRHFTGLVEALSEEVASEAAIEWIVDELHAGSAITTIRGVSDSEHSIESVIVAYENIGQSLERGRPIPHAAQVQREAVALTSLLNGSITAIRFETDDFSAFITSKGDGERPAGLTYAYGTVTGTVETLTRRRGLKFTLYDALFDKPVLCFLKREQERAMLHAWGRRVIVHGYVGRDPDKGHPVKVTEITSVEILPESEPGSYRRARGIASGLLGDERSEDVVRKGRDA